MKQFEYFYKSICILKSVHTIVTAFRIAYTDFELELMCSEENHDDSDDDSFITYRRSNRVKFKDDLSSHKSPYDVCDNSIGTSGKLDTCTQTMW